MGGGRPSIPGTVSAAILIAAVTNAFSLVGLSLAAMQLVTGMMFLVAVLLGILQRR